MLLPHMAGLVYQSYGYSLSSPSGLFCSVNVSSRNEGGQAGVLLPYFF